MRTLKVGVIALVVATELGALTMYSQEPADVHVLFQQLESLDTTNAAAEQLLNSAKENPHAREYLARRLPTIIAKGPDNHLQPWRNAACR